MTLTAEHETEAPSPGPLVQIQEIPLSRIFKSPTNPRKRRNEQLDAELADSIRKDKVRQPILLRPVGNKFEIVFGERRFDASIAAGKKTVPSMIESLSDTQVMELQIVENKDREDPDPFDEALGYKNLYTQYQKENSKAEAKQLLESMAARLSMKPRTMYQVMKLADLVPAAVKMLRAGKIEMSHAYEIARRPAKIQGEILQWIEQESYGDHVPSVRELKTYLAEWHNHFLDAAPFNKEDPKLVPSCGACTTCDKNTANNPNLLDEETAKKGGRNRAICTDNSCYSAKVAAHLVQIEKAAAQAGADLLKVSTEHHNPPKGSKAADEWKEVKAGSCQYATPAVIVDGDDTEGKQIHACIMNNLCKTHWTRSSAGRTPHTPRTDEQKKAILKKQRDNKLDQAVRVAATAAFCQRVTELKLPDLHDTALVMVHAMDRRLRNPLFEAMGWKPSTSAYGPAIPTAKIRTLKPAELARFIGLITVAPQILPGLDYYPSGPDISLADFARRHKLDLKKIEAEAAAPLKQQWKEIDARKKAKGKAKPAKKKQPAPAQTSAKKKPAAAGKKARKAGK